MSDAASISGRFASAATLLADMDALSHARTTSTTNRYQVIKSTFSLTSYHPGAFTLLLQTGRTFFQIRQQDLDLRYPGLYLHSIKSLEITFDGLLPAEGVHAVLRTVNQSTVRVPYDSQYVPEEALVNSDWAYPASEYPIGGSPAPAYVMKPLYGKGFSQILSEYKRTADRVVLAAPEGALDLFEHLGPDTMWLLEIPRAGNGFSLTQLADVRVDLYFTAHYNQELADRQQQALEEGARISRSVLLQASVQDAEGFAAWAEEAATHSAGQARILVFELQEEALPANLKDIVLQNFSCTFFGLEGQALDARFAFSAQLSTQKKAIFGHHATTTLNAENAPDGRVYTALGDDETILAEDGVTVLHEPREGDFASLEDLLTDLTNPLNSENFGNLFGRWVIKVLLEDNGVWIQRDEDGDPVQVTDGAIQLNHNGSALCEGGSWKHAEASVWVSPGEAGTFALALRETTASGADPITATMKMEPGTGSGTTRMTLALMRGGSVVVEVVSGDMPERDDWYQLTLRVVGTEAVLFLDQIEMLQMSWTATTLVAGSARVAWSQVTGSALVSEVVVQRLKHTGEFWEEVVREDFENDDAWVLTNATHTTSLHNQLDLSAISEVMLQIDYTCRIDFGEEA